MQLSTAANSEGSTASGTMSHSTIWSSGPSMNTGASVSTRETCCVTTVVFPHIGSIAAYTMSANSPPHCTSRNTSSSRSTMISPERPDTVCPSIVPFQANQPPKPYPQLWLLPPTPSWKRLDSETGMWFK